MCFVISLSTLSIEDNFKVPFAFILKKKGIGRFEGLPRFKWNDLGEQDVVGQGLSEQSKCPL